MWQAVRKEFEASPIQASAAMVALLAAPISLIGGAFLSLPSVQAPVSPAASAIQVQAPLRLLVVGAFAVTAAFGLAQLAVRVKPAATGFLCSILFALLAQSLVATFAWILLRPHFAFVTRTNYPAAVGAEPTTRTELLVANQDLNGFVFVLSALVVLVFLIATAHKAETEEDSVASEDAAGAILYAGLGWVALVMMLGGALLESIIRSGMPLPSQ